MFLERLWVVALSFSVLGQNAERTALDFGSRQTDMEITYALSARRGQPEVSRMALGRQEQLLV